MAFGLVAKDQLRPLVKLNDALRELASLEQDINVTSIVVVGDQSHGKSSVIEALSGIDLPRGEDIQTRLPLVLQLRRCAQPHEECAILSAEGIAERSIDLKDIADEVRKITTDVAGDGKDVLDKEVELKVLKVDQDDLTLIDLPGMTRVAVKGQHEEIEETITNMYKRYMTPEESILLNVVSAMVDFSTSKSLKLSRDLDSLGRRTILCVTKIDQHTDPGLVDKIGKAAEQLHLPPEHVFCVRNRSQPENDEEVDLAEARKREEEYFRSHREFEKLPTTSLSVSALSRKLVALQYDKIQATLPVASSKIHARIMELDKALAELGPIMSTAAECRSLFQGRLASSLQTLRDESIGRISSTCDDEEFAGRSFELQLYIEDLAKARKAYKFGDDIQSSEVRFGDVSFRLDVHPNLNEDWEKNPNDNDSEESKKRANYSVGTFLCVKRQIACSGGSSDSVSIDVEWVFHVSTDSGTESYDYEHTFEITPSNPNAGGYGGRSLIDASRAQKLGQVTFRAHAYIKSITRASAQSDDLMLCSAVHRQNKAFATSVNELFSNSYFFSMPFRRELEAKFQRRSGALGLPGTLVPEPALAVLKSMRAKLNVLVSSHIEAVKQIVVMAWMRSVSNNFGEFPRLYDVIKTNVNASLDAQEQLARRMVDSILAWEDCLVYTENHYFMDTVQSLRKVLLADGDGTLELPQELCFLGVDSIKKLCSLSNEEQRILDVQIEIFAYWKVLKKRLIDYVAMACQYELVRKPLDGMFAQVAQSAVEAACADSDSLVALMAPQESKRLKVEQMTTRLHALKQAQELLRSQTSDVVSSHLESSSARRVRRD